MGRLKSLLINGEHLTLPRYLTKVFLCVILVSMEVVGMTTLNKQDNKSVQLQRLSEESSQNIVSKRQSGLYGNIENMAEMSISNRAELVKDLHWGQNKSLRDIAKILGISHNSLSDYMTVHKIPKKTKAQSLFDKYNGHCPAWKGGRVFAKSGDRISGYWTLYKPEHPNADKRGYVPEHRYLMSEKIKRPIKKNEVVHHIDGNKTNNNLSNLEIRLRGGQQYHGVLTVCPKCGYNLLY